MLNPDNIIVVYYPIYGLRVRFCQTTVYPENVDRRDIIDPINRMNGYNKWCSYVHTEVALMSGHGESNLTEAKQILSKPIVNK